MRQATVLVHGIEAGVLKELDNDGFQFIYNETYNNAPVSLTMPVSRKIYEFERFPAFFEGLLPEGVMLDGLLRKYKLDKNDLFGQLIQVGHDLVGAVTVESKA
jgi:serine/threonine-protein kinase HipA